MSGQWVEDGIHPTPEAYEAWAEEMTDAAPAVLATSHARSRSAV